ncbi:hypothetical protein [Vitiosangium sp. GDMCC 1.1324]|uniref:hypothetical protein n=1 Tax=Vitiosangium sp. (strain GDMCC 1.1324) TaxID=2138576 RepID=UPI00130EFB96|nr:hypothetical protein [Vitiosangium sp. GDMCC 1.1324]
MAAITRDARAARQPRAGERVGRMPSGRALTDTANVLLCTVIPNVGLRKTVVTGASAGVDVGFNVVRLLVMIPPA